MQHKEERPSNPKVQAPSCIPDRFCDREDGGALGRPGSRDWIRSPPRSAKRARHLLLPFRSRLHLVGAAAFRCRSITGAGTCSIITLMQAGPAQRKARSRASGSSFALVTTSPYAPSASNTDMTWLPETVNTTRAPACSSARDPVSDSHADHLVAESVERAPLSNVRRRVATRRLHRRFASKERGTRGSRRDRRS